MIEDVYKRQLPEKEKEINSLFGRDDFFIEGNYCDMFDCGEYAYAVSNLKMCIRDRKNII